MNGRLVWIPEGTRDAIDALPHTDLLYALVEAYDAAPDDPTRVAENAMHELDRITPRPLTKRDLTVAVLAALGVPVVPEADTP